MPLASQNITNILVISLHGYVAAEPELGKPDTGGQVVFVLELAKRFSRLGLRVDVLTRRFEGQPEFDRVNDNLRVWRVPFGGDEFIPKEDMHDHLADFVTNTLSTMRSKGAQYDVVYSHYWDAGWAGQKIAEELEIPHIHTPHSLGAWKQNNMGADMTESEMEKYRFEERIRKEFLIYQLCDHVIATTVQQEDLLKEQYDLLETRITTIPPGMDEGRFSPIRQADLAELRKRYGLREHDVLALGRMAHNKGYDLLLNALPTLFEMAPDARLIAAIGGDESEQDERGVKQLKEQAQALGIEDKQIVWKKYVADEDLANFYRAPAVFALPSRYEPFGMVAIEAMACGTPSVITVHGGLFELIEFGKHALYADPNRPTEFGAMLALPMLHPRLAHRLSVEGARFARRNFGWTGIAKQTLGVFSAAKQQRMGEAV